MVRPVQPPPMITRSTGFNAVRGCLLTLVFPRRRLVLGDLLETRGLGTKGAPMMGVDVVSVAHLRPGKPDEFPADEVRVAAVHRIAEHRLDGVRAEEREELGPF